MSRGERFHADGTEGEARARVLLSSIGSALIQDADLLPSRAELSPFPPSPTLPRIARSLSMAVIQDRVAQKDH